MFTFRCPENKKPILFENRLWINANCSEKSPLTPTFRLSLRREPSRTLTTKPSPLPTAGRRREKGVEENEDDLIYQEYNEKSNFFL